MRPLRHTRIVVACKRTPRKLAIGSVLGILLLLDAGAASAQPRTVGNLKVETIATGLRNPWGLAFLPDGRMLVTERPGQMRIIARDGTKSAPLENVPRVFAVSQGGLLDVVVDRDFATNRTIFFCFAEPIEGGGRTSLARARLPAEGNRIEDVQVIFRQSGPPSRGNHWGCRITPTADGNLFLTLGDHFTARDEAQNLGNHIGKIVRLRRDGSAPPDNPFVNRNDAKPEIWSYGHRNLQGAALDGIRPLLDPRTRRARRRRNQRTGGRQELWLAHHHVWRRLQRRQDRRRHAARRAWNSPFTIGIPRSRPPG